MIDFIVSGQIPGIHLEVTFLLWQMLTVSILTYAALRLARRFKRPTTTIEDEV